MKRRELRSPRERVGTLPNADIPPPERAAAASEALLRRALLLRDEQAFETVARRLRPEMIRIATRYVRSADDAEDVVQDTWLAALAGIRRFEGRASLRTWLLRILGYRARTAGQRASRQVPMSQLVRSGGGELDAAPGAVEERDPAFARPPARPDEVLLGRELGARLQACMATLPPRQREVVALRDLEGWSSAEVCRRLGVSESNQRVLLHRARRQLRRGLSDDRGPPRRQAA